MTSMQPNIGRATTLLLLWLAATLAVAWQPSSASAQSRRLPTPAGPASGQPNLAVGRDGSVYLSWIERLPDQSFVLKFSRKQGAGWSTPQTIAAGRNWFVNWADFPSLFVLPDGTLAAHWLVKSGPDTYAYDVHLARSVDGGKSWSEAVKPHRDGKQTEHGFVSMFPAPAGRLGLVWLDGREMVAHAGGGHDGHGGGNMTLRSTSLGRDGKLAAESLLDERVCECCQTSAAVTSEGPVVVYRDRSAEEVRDISIVRLRDGKWSAPAPVHRDGWKIAGCPVNGPAVDARGKSVVVAWFTGANDVYQVKAAFSQDAGHSFSPPVRVDDGGPMGRVGVVALEDGSAVVSWLEKTATGGEVRVRRVHKEGKLGPAQTVAPMATARASGFPRMVRIKDSLVFAWVGGTQVLTAELLLP
jgi:hypothetical protein